MSRPSLVMPISARRIGRHHVLVAGVVDPAHQRSPRGDSGDLGRRRPLELAGAERQDEGGAEQRAPRKATLGQTRSFQSLAFPILAMSIDDRRDLLELAVADRAEEAVVPAGVAGDAGLVDQDQQGVAVAIDAQIDQVLDVARRVALAPRRLARARPVADAARAHGLGDGVAIHPGHHQHLAGVVLLGDRRAPGPGRRSWMAASTCRSRPADRWVRCAGHG